ncbi:DUF1127 domain-containing protein [Halomonas sp. V046]|uniref:DUF1127 domain-containing protein n=1 Tax=Halomonas sp. V046 TaxID=3459611 RepID=UPI0040444108
MPRLLRRIAARALRACRRRRRYRCDWHHLAEMDDHLLKDIGLHRQQLRHGWRSLRRRDD